MFHAQAIIPSLIWLLLVGAVLFGVFKEFGAKRVAINILGAYLRSGFIQTIRCEGGSNEIQFGYCIFGHRFLYLKVAAGKITQVDWHRGQGSSRLGKDIGDWHVALWYEHGDPEKSKKQHRMLHPDQEVYIVGLDGPKEETAALGHALVDFLRQSGVSLAQGKNDCSFVRPGSEY